MQTPKQVADQLKALADEIEQKAAEANLTVYKDALGVSIDAQAIWKVEEPAKEKVFTIVQTVLLQNSKRGSKVLRYIPRFEVLDVITDSYTGNYLEVVYSHPALGETIGWVEKVKTEPYYPCPEGLTLENAFMPDLKRIYIPQDEPAPGARAKQYLNLESISGMGKSIHYNLCGPFCTAALKGRDVIPMLETWCSMAQANFNMIYADQPMGLGQIESMLNRPVTYLTFSPATNPLTARILKTFCDNGYMVIGVGIDNNGVIQVNGYIRHWAIVLDVIPCSTGGFVRVYNPFQNREETYDFSTVWGSMFPGGAGSRVLLTDL